MRGDDRVRYCSKCSLKVYNIAQMSHADVEQLVLKHEGRLCGRIYVRGDRTATASDCPDRTLRKKARALYTLMAVLSLSAIFWIVKPHRGLSRSALPPLFRTAVDWIDPEPRPKCSVGILIRPTPVPVPPPPSSAPAPGEQP